MRSAREASNRVCGRGKKRSRAFSWSLFSLCYNLLNIWMFNMDFPSSLQSPYVFFQWPHYGVQDGRAVFAARGRHRRYLIIQGAVPHGMSRAQVWRLHFSL